MKEILDDVGRWQERGEKVAIATVVATRKSAPRPVGSKLAISESGELAGSVSGGCVESDVYENARDGWYVNPAGNYRLGGQAGASFRDHELAVRAGILRDMMGGRPMFPLYATLAFSTSW